MAFKLPVYQPPDFSRHALAKAPLASFAPAPAPGVAPAGFHATTIFPEYLHLYRGDWRLLTHSRMDCVVVRQADDSLAVREFRHLRQGDPVALGRRENGEDGIWVHTEGFALPAHAGDKFAFRTRVSRETSFSIDYDELYDLLEYERRHGAIVWVLGPAVVFDSDARDSVAYLIEQGFVHALLAGNALATHDLEAALFGTALGQEIYSKRGVPLGHYHHLDTINQLRQAGSLAAPVEQGLIKSGIIRAAIRRGIPLVLAGSIRDDGPLPGVLADAYQAQDRMRAQLAKATTVVGLATQLHTIAAGNMVPSYHVTSQGQVRPVFFYVVDMSEFATSKLADRGSLAARSILTNAQDFVVNVARNLAARSGNMT